MSRVFEIHVPYESGLDKFHLINTAQQAQGLIISKHSGTNCDVLRVYPYKPNKYKIVDYCVFAFLRLKLLLGIVK